jgi:hypothetical protein
MMNTGTKSRKRQRASTDNKGRNLRKRPKKSFKEASTQESDEFQAWWSVSAVVAERRRPGKSIEYQVLWDPNSETGETYPPSWVRSEDLTADLLAEWQHKRRKSGDLDEADGEPRSQAAFTLGGDNSLDSVFTVSASTYPTSNRQAFRRHRVIEDSSDYDLESPASSTAPSPRRAPPNQAQHLDPASPAAEIITESGHNQHNAAVANAVFITQKDDFDRDEYLIGLSQANQSQLSPSSAQEDSRVTPGIQPHPQPTGAKTRLVIPDSQSQNDTGLDFTSPISNYSNSSSERQQVSNTIFVEIFDCCFDILPPLVTSRS